MVNKPIKQEDGKGESAGLAMSNIPADALNRLIAMGGPPGEPPLLHAIDLMAVLSLLSVPFDRPPERQARGVTAYFCDNVNCKTL